MRIAIGVRTDVGLVRTNNEDHFAADPSLNLLILCDGMGGQAAGEVASKLGVNVILEHCRQAEKNPTLEWIGGYRSEFTTHTNRLVSGVRLSNQAIFEAASQQAAVNGMGSTVVSARIAENILSVAHVGDSRLYLFRNGQLQQLTRDHSLVMEQVRQGLISREEAERSELANVILRALGAEETVEVDVDEVWVTAGDQILLCSDGLTRMVPDTEIAQVLANCNHPQQAADGLVELANQHGGEDNITVIVVRLFPPLAGWQRWLRFLWGGSREWPN